MNSNIQTKLFTEQEAPPIGNVLLADSASYQIIQVALELAYEAGKWAGQVELEERKKHWRSSRNRITKL